MGRYLGQGFAESLAETAGLADGDKEIIAYGLEYFLSNVIGIVLTLLASYLLGSFWEAVSAMFAWALVRRFAGGAHSSSWWRCAANSCLVLLTLVILTRGLLLLLPITVMVIAGLFWTMAVTWLKAPVGSRQKPLQHIARRRRLRRQALITELTLGAILFSVAVAGNPTFDSLVVSALLGLAAEALMLTQAGFILTRGMDRCWDWLLARKGGEKP